MWFSLTLSSLLGRRPQAYRPGVASVPGRRPMARTRAAPNLIHWFAALFLVVNWGLTEAQAIELPPVFVSFDGPIAVFSLSSSTVTARLYGALPPSVYTQTRLRAGALIQGAIQDPIDTSRDTLTVWERYRIYVLVLSVVLVGQLVLIALLLLQRKDRRRAEETLRARETALRGSYERIRQLAGRLIHAQEAARASLARDLHDEICQQLAAVSLGVVSLRRSSGDIKDAANQQAFADLEYQTQVTFDGIRRLSHDLHPMSLRLLGLGPALKTHCLDIGERQHIRVAFSSSGDFRGLASDVAICLYRIAQEALRNAIVHGQARKISVSIARLDDAVEMVVTDDGQGFDVEAMRLGSEGLGLVSMEERARIVGGSVDIVSSSERGTTVRVRCPSDLVGMEVANAI